MKNIEESRYSKNSIVFCSTSNAGHEVISYKNEEGKIYTKVTPKNYNLKIDSLFLDEDFQSFKYWIVFLMDSILVSISLFAFRSPVLTVISLSYSILVSFEIAKLITYTFGVKFGKRKLAAKLHAAGHMVINAYAQLQRIPTLEEVKTFSMLSSSCKTLDSFFSLTLMLSLTICMVIEVILQLAAVLYALLLFLLILLNYISYKMDLLKYWQLLILSKPTDYELQMALAALKKYSTIPKK